MEETTGDTAADTVSGTGAAAGQVAVGAPVNGDGAAAPEATRAQRIDQIVALAHTKPKEYANPALQEELRTLLAAAELGEDDDAAEGDGDEEPGKAKDAKGAKVEEKEDDEAEAAEEDDPDALFIPERPSGEERSELDQTLLASAIEQFREAGWDQSMVDTAIAAYDAAEAAAAERNGALIAAKATENIETLRDDLGKGYGPQIEAANQLVRQELGAFGLDAAARLSFLDTRLEDGSRLGDFPPFVKMLSKLAMAKGSGGRAPDDLRKPGETHEAARQRRISEITRLPHVGRTREYEALLPELKRLLANGG